MPDDKPTQIGLSNNIAPGRIVIRPDQGNLDESTVMDFINDAGFTVTDSIVLPDGQESSLFHFTRNDGVPPGVSETQKLLADLNRSSGSKYVAEGIQSLLIPGPATSPNPSSTGGAVGAPGSGSTNCAVYDPMFELLDTDITDRFRQATQGKSKRAVRVYVLDTSPYGTKPDKIPEGFSAQLAAYLLGGNTPAPYLQRFLNLSAPPGQPKTSIQVRPSSNADDDRQDVSDMSYHGLFVASIIKSIEPEATVEVLPVFGKNGEAGLDDIVRALDEVNKDYDGNTEILVNISATTQTSYSAQNLEDVAQDLFSKGIDIDYWGDIAETYGIMYSFRKRVCDFSERDHARIVASAGNIGFDAQDRARRWPSFPARIRSVLSVGAIDFSQGNQYVPAYYSHLSRIPADLPSTVKDYLESQLEVSDNGIYVYGGVELSKRGIFGLFLKSETDEGKDNGCGVAEWSGTSFAAAVATGYMARLCRYGLTAKEANDTLLRLPRTINDGYTTTIPALMAVQRPLPI